MQDTGMIEIHDRALGRQRIPGDIQRGQLFRWIWVVVRRALRKHAPTSMPSECYSPPVLQEHHLHARLDTPTDA